MLRTKNKTLFKLDNPLWLLISLVGTLLAHPLLEEQLAKPIFYSIFLTVVIISGGATAMAFRDEKAELYLGILSLPGLWIFVW